MDPPYYLAILAWFYEVLEERKYAFDKSSTLSEELTLQNVQK